MLEIVYIKKFNLNTPTWSELLNDFNLSAELGENIQAQHGFYVSRSAYRIKKIKKVLEQLNLNVAHLYMNVSSVSPTFGNHKDGADIYYWQVRGKSKWIIQNQTEYILNKGDLIIIPKNTEHSVTPLGPRAGISMSNEVTKYDPNGKHL